MNEFPQIICRHNIGNTIEIPNQIDVKVFTYLGNNYAPTATSLLSDNASDFTSPGNILLLLSSMGAENTEIVVSSSHTANTFTTAATTQTHNRGDLIQELKYDQIVISKSATINGVYAVLTTQVLNVTEQNTHIFDTVGLSTDYYKIQWKNSLTGLLSGYSDPVSVDSYPTNSVASVIFPVLKAMGVSENDPKINVEFCLGAIDDARKFTEAKLYGIRHAWSQEFEYPVKMLAGTNYITLPDNIDYNETDRSVLAVRFLIDNILTPYNLRYIDKRMWNQVSFSVAGGISTVVAGIGAVTLSLVSVGDFPASGVCYVATTDFTQTVMQISYTAKDNVTNQLTGVTGITRAIPIGTQIWQRPTIAQPISYTVYENRLVFDRIIPDSMQGRNVYLDYYKKTDEVENLYQILPEHYRETYKWYLRYAIKYRKDIKLGSDDPDLKKFESLVQALYDNLYTGQGTIIITN